MRHNFFVDNNSKNILMELSTRQTGQTTYWLEQLTKWETEYEHIHIYNPMGVNFKRELHDHVNDITKYKISKQPRLEDFLGFNNSLFIMDNVSSINTRNIEELIDCAIAGKNHIKIFYSGLYPSSVIAYLTLKIKQIPVNVIKQYSKYNTMGQKEYSNQIDLDLKKYILDCDDNDVKNLYIECILKEIGEDKYKEIFW